MLGSIGQSKCLYSEWSTFWAFAGRAYQNLPTNVLGCGRSSSIKVQGGIGYEFVCSAIRDTDQGMKAADNEEDMEPGPGHDRDHRLTMRL